LAFGVSRVLELFIAEVFDIEEGKRRFALGR